jgi:hypothetical protein
MAYVEIVKTEKRFIPNVVILIDSTYYGIRNPDSGLTITAPFDKCISSLVLNPTSIDIKRVNTTITSYSFRLVDFNGVISNLIAGNAASFIGKEVTIYLGRSRINTSEDAIPFSDYYQLPKTRIKKVEHSDNSYSFSSNEDTDRMNQPIYDQTSALAADILSGTTTLTMRDAIDSFPAAGFLKINDEFLSYASKDNVAKTFLGVIRGELNSIPAAHKINTSAFLVQTITDNPLNIILRLLISGGGGGTYDNLQDGCGIANTLIDIAEIETLKDNLFLNTQFKLSFYNVPSALKLIEEQILQPCNLRFTYSKNSKLTLAILDRAVFVEETDVIDENSITKYPKWSVDDSKIINSLKIAWDYDEGTNQFRKTDVIEDAASIAAYGKRTPLSFSFKGIQETLDGQDFVSTYANTILIRLSQPVAEVSISTHIDKSLQTIGDKALIKTNTIPNTDGTLNFASEMEIVERAINFQTGDVNFKLAFTSFTGIRSCYIAPSDLFSSVVNQNTVTVPPGRGAFYLVGWKVRLFDNVTRTYLADPVNTIASVVSDTITFQNNWTTTLTTNFKLKFADYDDATDSQKRYCYISDSGANFDDGKPTYRITF